MSLENNTNVQIEILLNLYVAFGRMAIFTVLILPNHEQRMLSHFPFLQRNNVFIVKLFCPHSQVYFLIFCFLQVVVNRSIYMNSLSVCKSCIEKPFILHIVSITFHIIKIDGGVQNVSSKIFRLLYKIYKETVQLLFSYLHPFNFFSCNIVPEST